MNPEQFENMIKEYIYVEEKIKKLEQEIKLAKQFLPQIVKNIKKATDEDGDLILFESEDHDVQECWINIRETLYDSHDNHDNHDNSRKFFDNNVNLAEEKILKLLDQGLKSFENVSETVNKECKNFTELFNEYDAKKSYSNFFENYVSERDQTNMSSEKENFLQLFKNFTEINNLQKKF